METLHAKKMKMTQIWKKDTVVPVTVLGVNESDSAMLSNFKEGDVVKVTGTSKGKGFQGVVKRHGFHGGPKTHGQKDRLRAPGSLGPTAPQRVLKGRKMAGHMGSARVTVRNLTIADVRAEEKLIFIRGAVPGAIGGVITIRK